VLYSWGRILWYFGDPGKAPRALADTMLQVRRAIRGFLGEFPEYERLLPHVKGIL